MFLRAHGKGKKEPLAYIICDSFISVLLYRLVLKNYADGSLIRYAGFAST